ncbi:hypothetical protein GWK47_001930 [Chionoecetes opilio]|uniref:Uncharacterized protein n=1 Tax=Chionoecetes opilio TaxID=41210 RepID=A0A8J4XW60_CHIOP|nr:hypothetical protein GWK47_001930 [Chionoecetes opilio]
MMVNHRTCLCVVIFISIITACVILIHLDNLFHLEGSASMGVNEFGHISSVMSEKPSPQQVCQVYIVLHLLSDCGYPLKSLTHQARVHTKGLRGLAHVIPCRLMVQRAMSELYCFQKP